MEKLDLYREWYYKELERKNTLEESLNFPFGIVSALIAIWYYFFSNFDFNQDESNRCFFIVLLLVSIVLTVVAVLFLLTTYHNFLTPYKYGYLKSAEEIVKYRNKLIKWHEENGSTEIKAEKEFQEDLLKMYTDAATLDSHSNKRKTALLHRGKTTLYYAILSILILSFSFSYNIFHNSKPETIYKIEITNPK